MNEDKYLELLNQSNVDIELLFLKYLMDRELTEERMGDYACKYTSLSDSEKWEAVKRYKEEINKDTFLWQSFLDNIEL